LDAAGVSGQGYRGTYWHGPGTTDLQDGRIVARPVPYRPNWVEYNHLPPEVVEWMKPEREKSKRKLNRREVRHRILAMVNMLMNAEALRRTGHIPQLYFWTVDFRLGLTEDMCYHLFNTWLTQLRQSGMIRSYLWVAEKQKNGTTHFHILIPHYMNVVRANRMMRTSICYMIRHGKIGDYPLSLAKRYNGVDIAKEINPNTGKRVGGGKPVNFASKSRRRALARYVTKYISKNEAEYDRQPWHCSRDWTALIKGVNFTERTILEHLPNWQEVTIYSKFENEFMKFSPWNTGPPGWLVSHLADINYSAVCWTFGVEGGNPYFISKN
jgi:hypothetical protein